MAESDPARTIPHEMKAVPVLVALAVVAAPGAAGQDRLPAAARLVDARACGAAPAGPGAVVTITPDGDGVRDCVALRIRLERPASVELVVLQRKPRPGVVGVERVAAPAGLATLVWSPPPATAARTYPTRIVVRTDRVSAFFAGPVVRIRGLTARFERETYVPGAVARLRIDGGDQISGRAMVVVVSDVAADRNLPDHAVERGTRRRVDGHRTHARQSPAADRLQRRMRRQHFLKQEAQASGIL